MPRAIIFRKGGAVAAGETQLTMAFTNPATTNQYLSRADNAAFAVTDMTISAWVVPYGVGGHYALQWGSAGNRGFILAQSGARRVYMQASPDGTAQPFIENASTLVTLGQLNHVVGRVLGLTYSAVCNGDIVSGAYAGGVFNSTADFQVGGPNFLRGLMGRLCFWGRGLSDAEIATLYNGGTPLSVADTQALFPIEFREGWELDETSTFLAPVTRVSLSGTLNLTDNNNVGSGVRGLL